MDRPYYFVDWTDFSPTVLQFIRNNGRDNGGYFLISQKDVLQFIKDKYKVGRVHSLFKLRQLAAIRKDLMLVELKPPQGAFIKQPRLTKFLTLRKRG